MSGDASSNHFNTTGNLAFIELMFHDAIFMEGTMTDFMNHFQTYANANGYVPDAYQNDLASSLNTVSVQLQTPVKKGWFKKSSPAKGLYVWGGVGRGKTMIMDLFFNHIDIDEKRRVHFNIFMIDVHNSIALLREEGQGKDPLKTIAADIADNTRLLCFDEFQVYDIADAMVLSGLFSELFKRGVTIIATSNVAPDLLYKDGLQRARFLPFIDVVKAHMNVIHIDGDKDYRQQLIDESGVYFVNNINAFNKTFERLTNHANTDPVHVDVRGRHIQIKKFYDQVCMVAFNELCEKPRAAADYKALCDRFHTVFLSFVPRMGYDRRNELKRFILLVDTLYDAQIRLVVNAEDVPSKLYSGKDHAFEFERTISRLTEMQGPEYLAKTGIAKSDKN